MKLTNLIPTKVGKKLSRLCIIGALSLGSSFMYAQNQQVRLAGNNLTLKAAFKQIEQQTKLFVDYNIQDINDARVIKKVPTGNNVKNVLEQLLEGTNCVVTFSNGHAIISKKTLASSKTKKVSGVIKDELGEPVIGANVVEKGTTNGTVTDIDGKFNLEVNPNAMLTISYIGYTDKVISVKNQSVLNVSLEEDLQNLEEVVVVGYGTQKKVNLTGAVSSVSTKDLTKRQVGSTSLALQGLIPGVSIVQRSGQPGADGGTVSIRGKTTLGNNDALVLVDGVEMSLNNIDPSLIESISVLKDASSSSIYGSRAANGVILVTTKRADAEKFSISYNGYVGFQKPTDLPEMVNALDHMDLLNIAYKNVGMSPLYSDSYIEEYRREMVDNPDKYPNTDWLDLTLKNSGLVQNHFVTLSGGGKKIKTIASLGYFNQEGIIPNSDYNRYTFRVNTDMNFSEKIAVKVDANILLSKTNSPARGAGSAFHWATRIPANQAGVFSSGQWGEGWNGDNPIAFTKDGGLKTQEDPSVILNFDLNYKPTDWLRLQAQYAPKYVVNYNSVYTKSIQTYYYDGSPAFTAPQKSTLTNQTNRNFKDLLTLTANFEKEIIRGHSLKILLGYQQESYKHIDHQGYREVFIFPDYPVLNAGGEENQKAYGSATDWSLQSYFGRINYDYKGKYLLEANVRYDGSSRFASGNKWGVFPSFSVGWRISEEAFWEPAKNVIDNLKLRASWGQLGNQNIGDNYPFSSVVDLTGKYVFDKSVHTGASISNLANKRITWETTTVTDVGLDLTLGGKLNISADYFYKVTDDILLKLDVPLTIGMAAPQQNAGKVENKGWEVGITYADHVGDFNYRIGANISDVKNKVLDLKGIDETGLTVNREGEEMNSLFGLEADGFITPEDYDVEGNYLGATQYGNFGPGDIKYKDQNGDGVINTSDRVIIGGTIPRYTFGLSFYGEYKGLDLNLLFQGVGRANGYINEHGIIPFYMGGTAQEMHKDYWREDNRDALFPRLAFNEVNNNQNSSFWIRNAAYLRLKNIQIGYTFPQKWISKAHFSFLRFYLSVDNLLTFDNFWDSYDVEAPVGNGGFYPQMKTFSLGLDVRF